MTRILLLVVLVSILPQQSARACEACGCNLGGSYFGITPQFNRHFIGFRYSNATYKGAVVHQSGVLEDEHSTDTYYRYEMIGRFRITPRIQASALIPYQVNVRDGSDERSELSGFGDPTLIAYYQPVKASTEGAWKHALLLGSGVKLPLGKHNATNDGLMIHQNAQLGTGSFDLLFTANYTVRYRQFGLNTEQSLKLNGTNRRDYRFGNQLTSAANFFFWVQNPYLAVLPVAGVQYEQARRQYDGLVMQENSGGKIIYLNLGAQVFHKSWGLNAYYHLPIAQHFNTEEGGTITAKNRLTVSITKSFGKE